MTDDDRKQYCRIVNSDPHEVDDYCGLCPKCVAEFGIPANGYPFVNCGSAHWFFCELHRVMWCFGCNIFSSWKDQTEAEQEEIFISLGLETFEHVKPAHQPTDMKPQRFDPRDAMADERDDEQGEEWKRGSEPDTNAEGGN